MRAFLCNARTVLAKNSASAQPEISSCKGYSDWLDNKGGLPFVSPREARGGHLSCKKMMMIIAFIT